MLSSQVPRQARTGCTNSFAVRSVSPRLCRLKAFGFNMMCVRVVAGQAQQAAGWGWASTKQQLQKPKWCFFGKAGVLGGPVAAGCCERPRLSFKLCCSRRVKRLVMAAASPLAPYDATCSVVLTLSFFLNSSIYACPDAPAQHNRQTSMASAWPQHGLSTAQHSTAQHSTAQHSTHSLA